MYELLSGTMLHQLCRNIMNQIGVDDISLLEGRRVSFFKGICHLPSEKISFLRKRERRREPPTRQDMASTHTSSATPSSVAFEIPIKKVGILDLAMLS